MGCNQSKSSNILSHLDDSVKVMVRHDEQAAKRHGVTSTGYKPRASHPLLNQESNNNQAKNISKGIQEGKEFDIVVVQQKDSAKIGVDNVDKKNDEEIHQDSAVVVEEEEISSVENDANHAATDENDTTDKITKEEGNAATSETEVQDIQSTEVDEQQEVGTKSDSNNAKKLLSQSSTELWA